MRFFTWVVVNAVALAVAAWLVDGITLTAGRGGDGPPTTRGLLTLLGVAVVFGVINTVVRPLLTLLSLPFVILTLGLFLLVINGLMLMLTSLVSQQLGLGFRVDGFGAAVLGAVVVTIATWVLDLVFPDPQRRPRRARVDGYARGRR